MSISPPCSMNTLPISIEDHLADAGFSGTEILLLRHLFSGQLFTIRELASKTGKSTGLLDIAMKKLSLRGVIKKELYNDTPKYSIDSVMSLSNYLKKHVQTNIDRMKRKEEDVEAFLSTITIEVNRPHIEYFEGKKGIIQAWRHLIETASQRFDIIGYIPLTALIDSEFKDVQEEVVKMRSQSQVRARFLTHETLLGKRYQEKDIFCARQTRFIDSDRCLLNTAHIMSANLYACIDYELQSAYIIVFADLVTEKRALFEGHWQDAQHTKLKAPNTEEKDQNSNIQSLFTPANTKIIASLFIMSLLATYCMQYVHASVLYSTIPLLSVADFLTILFLTTSTWLWLFHRSFMKNMFHKTFAKLSFTACFIVALGTMCITTFTTF